MASNKSRRTGNLSKIPTGTLARITANIYLLLQWLFSRLVIRTANRFLTRSSAPQLPERTSIPQYSFSLSLKVPFDFIWMAVNLCRQRAWPTFQPSLFFRTLTLVAAPGTWTGRVALIQTQTAIRSFCGSGLFSVGRQAEQKQLSQAKNRKFNLISSLHKFQIIWPSSSSSLPVKPQPGQSSTLLRLIRLKASLFFTRVKLVKAESFRLHSLAYSHTHV